MYSFDNTDNSYKYESIQHGYEVEYYDEDELDVVEISLELSLCIGLGFVVTYLILT